MANDTLLSAMTTSNSDWNKKYNAKNTALAVTNGGTFAADTQFTPGTLVTPTKDGAIFKGWYDNADFTDEAVNTAEAGKTYYAKWTGMDDMELQYGAEQKIAANGVENLSGYESDNTSVATVDAEGNVKAVGVGTATISATGTYNEESTTTFKMTVTVTPRPINYTLTNNETGSGSITYNYSDEHHALSDSMTFKWADELRETRLLEMEWSASRTGLINPVAIFEPVELEGTTVSRASVHNISIVRGLKLGIGDRITVYKANMIIPQIAENLTKSDSLEIPEVCPVCGQPTRIGQTGDAQTLICDNPDCDAKKIKSFTLLVSRDALNVDGLSESTLEKFLAKGFLHEFADLFRLERFREEITQMEGFGEKSFQNLMESLEKARKTTLPRLLYGLGIENVGVANAKLLCRHFQYDLQALREADEEELAKIDGVGEVIARSIYAYFHEEKAGEQLKNLLGELEIEREAIQESEQTLAGMSFVITGSLSHFENRNAMKEEIEKRGGKVTGSVTGKTVCLINNDTASSSSKNKKAKELEIPILSEEAFMEEYLK